MNHGLKRIVWAVDPLEEDKRTRTRGIHIVKDFAKKNEARINPVYVLSDGWLDTSSLRQSGPMTSDFTASSERALERFLESAKISHLEAAKVLVCEPASKSTAAEALDEFARSQAADLILVTSHGRGGLKRTLLGSFAETLAMHARTPIMICGPKVKSLGAFGHILFATDFSTESEKAFAGVLRLASKVDAKVTLFHAVFSTLDPIVNSGVGLIGGGYFSLAGAIDIDYSEQKKEAESWVARAARSGVKADAIFETKSVDVVESILKYAARKHFGLVAMASQSGPIAAALLGSRGREVARRATCPVLLLR